MYGQEGAKKIKTGGGYGQATTGMNGAGGARGPSYGMGNGVNSMNNGMNGMNGMNNGAAYANNNMYGAMPAGGYGGGGYSEGATKVNAGKVAGAANGAGGNPNGDGAAYGSMYGAGGAAGAGGYGGGSMYGAGGSMYGGGMPMMGMGGGYQGLGGSMYGGGGSMYGGAPMGSMMGIGFDEQIVVTKLFSSRRDLDTCTSAVDFGRRNDSYWGHSFGSTSGAYADNSLYRNAPDVDSTAEPEPEPRGATGEDKNGKEKEVVKAKEVPKPEPKPKTVAAVAPPPVSATPAKPKEVAPQPAKPREAQKVPTPQPVAVKKETSEASAPVQKKRDLADIPLLREDVKAEQSAPPNASAAATKASTSVFAGPIGGEPAPTTAARDLGPIGVNNGRTSQGRQSRHRPQSRSHSRALAMDEVVIPVADEVKDEMTTGGLEDPVKEAKKEAERVQRQKERGSQKMEKQKQREVATQLQKEREEENRKKREERAAEDRKRKEEVARMDAEKRQIRERDVQQREQAREQEKRAFQEQQRADEEREKARVAALLKERERKIESSAPAAGGEKRTESRPRSGRHSRPMSRPGSALRGAIPEQPPEEEAGQIKDTMAEGLGKGHESESQSKLPTRGSAKEVVRATPSSNATAHKTPTPASNAAKAPPQTAVTPSAPPPQNTSTTPSDRGVRDSKSGNSSVIPPAPDANQENTVKTLVLVEKIGKSNNAFQHTDNTVTYNNKSLDVTEVKARSEGSFNYQSSVVHDVREAVCNGFNAAVLSVEAPNTASRFDSPVWPILNRIVRSVLHANTQENGELNPNFDLTCAIGYINNDRVKDLLSEDDSSPFESIVVHPSPIYGPRIQQLRYGQITSGNGFEEVLSASLSRASEDTVLSTMTEGVAVAFVLAKQIRVVDGNEDIFLSSLVVASAGSDVTPYECGLNRVRNDYGTIFHLVLGGPCYTCFMFNTADDDSIRAVGNNDGDSTAQELTRLYDLLEKMASLKNYPLRSGSVKRFINYVEKALQDGQERLKGDVDEVQKAKLERYTNEQQRLLKGAYKMLEDAGISAKEL